MSDESRIGDPIAVDELVAEYRRAFGVDIERFFPARELTLDRVAPYGFYRFGPVRSGDDRFYNELMDRIGYEDGDRSEFHSAGTFVKRGDRVLDVGSGPGRFAAYCAGEYKGIELNPAAVREAQEAGLNVHLGKLEDQEAGAYDVVTLFQVLEHVDDPVGFLTLAARCVAPGGLLLVSTPDREAYIGRETNHLLNYPPHHLSWFSSGEIASMAWEQGFETVEVWREKLRPMHLSNWLNSKLNPLRCKHIDRSVHGRSAHFTARVIARVVRRFWMPKVTGQCMLVVSRRTA